LCRTSLSASASRPSSRASSQAAMQSWRGGRTAPPPNESSHNHSNRGYDDRRGRFLSRSRSPAGEGYHHQGGAISAVQEEAPATHPHHAPHTDGQRHAHSRHAHSPPVGSRNSYSAVLGHHSTGWSACMRMRCCAARALYSGTHSVSTLHRSPLRTCRQ